MAKKTPSLLRRDANNRLIDPDEGRKIADQLTKKLIHEQRLYDKDNTLNVARGRRRDIEIHIAVTVTNRIDGHPVIGEQDREYNQWVIVLPAKVTPLRSKTVMHSLAKLCIPVKQALMRLGYAID